MTNSLTQNNAADTEKTSPTTNHPIATLTSFQKRILAVLADNSRYGLAIKRELEEYYGKEVHHGRLYPNLNDLATKGLVDKSELDKRTNEYALTERGRRAIQADVRWLTDRVEHDTPKPDEEVDD
ncbi:PadR family transcriptional regulator [Halobacterium sp. BOL4-2]|uniref:PadR family transcriptional regulator n=1 Tax=Halobacterium sp. BOL4-2 TaxID=2810537 RepID=UPI0019623CC4|nr:PadR family transcriptional regulator [Halobacterium sp. BOL4-2]QRY26388.1 PadR family transcriptional regulator [Halobacterium sp. BOL4-2]